MVPAAAALALGADPDRPHDHQGILAPYQPGPVSIELDAKQEEKLAEGDVVILTVDEGEAGGRGVAVQDIAAPPEVVWSRIKGFEHYPEWVGPVKIAEVYRRNGADTYTHMKVSGFLYSYEYFLRNTWWPDADMLTWVLDYDRSSDFDDCVGAWYVEPHPDRKGWSRAWFSSDLRLRGAIPGFLLDFIKKQGLKDATAWVKKQSELAAAAPPDSG